MSTKFHIPQHTIPYDTSPTKPTPLPLRRQPQAATSIKLVEPSFDTIWLQIFFLSATISVVIFSLLQQDLFLSGFFCKTLRAKKIPGFSRTRKVSEANPSQAENQISPKKKQFLYRLCVVKVKPNIAEADGISQHGFGQNKATYFT